MQSWLGAAAWGTDQAVLRFAARWRRTGQRCFEAREMRPSGRTASALPVDGYRIRRPVVSELPAIGDVRRRRLVSMADVVVRGDVLLTVTHVIGRQSPMRGDCTADERT